MDILSITAGVIAIIQIADRVVSSCKSYITSVRDAPKDLRTIAIEVAGIKSILELLDLLLQGNDHQSSSAFEGLGVPGGPLEHCRKALEALDSLLSESECALENGKRRRTTLTLKTLAWPLKQSKARKILDDLKCYKSTISLAITTESAHDIKEIGGRVVRLGVLLTNAERESIFKWLVVHDSSDLHAGACDVHEPDTGKWLTNSPDYRGWIGGSQNFLWIHGIPGSGKTVLASHIIEEAKKVCSAPSSAGVGYAYYYFWFKREKDEVSQFLRWTINQLCRQSGQIPNEIRKLYNDGGTPTTASLIIALAAAIEKFEHVYLVIDALDETSNRTSLLGMLHRVHSDNRFKKISVLATSREELDIKESLKDISTSISLHNRWVDEDIRTFVQNHLRTDKKLNRWPEDIRSEIETTLVKGAKGMFRWAFCQLDIIGRLKSAADIRKALTRLPATLFETYDRIIAAIPTENIKYARRVLHLLCFDFSINTLGALAEAVIFDDTTCTFVQEDRFLALNDILDICTCLIKCTKPESEISKLSKVQLAHYSVKEYLVSEHIKGTTFATSETEANFLAAKICLTYHLNLDFSGHDLAHLVHNTADGIRDGILPVSGQANGLDPLRSEFPLVEMVGDFNRFVKSSRKEEIFNDMVLRLVNPGRPHFDTWWDLFVIFYRGWVPTWTFPPGAALTASLAYLCWLDLFSAAKDLLQRNPHPAILNTQLGLKNPTSVYRSIPWLSEGAHGTPLHVATLFESERFIELLIANGADANVVSACGFCPLNIALRWFNRTDSWLRIVAILLKGNANPNLACLVETPLQSALYRTFKGHIHFLEVVQMLLDAGADVNATGDDQAIAAATRFFLRTYRDKDLLREFNRDRGTAHYYRSPLLMVEDAKKYPNVPTELIQGLKDLLISYGATLFCRQPHHTDIELKLKGSKIDLEDPKSGI